MKIIVCYGDSDTRGDSTERPNGWPSVWPNPVEGEHKSGKAVVKAVRRVLG